MKKLLTIAMITLAAFAAKADLYLYWTIDAAGFTGTAYAVLENGNGNYVASMPMNSLNEEGKSAVNVSYFTDALSYYVALYDSALSKIAVSGELTYAAIADHTYNRDTSIDAIPSGIDALLVSGFTATIPEPTSGLMLLLGLGALALKRKVA